MITNYLLNEKYASTCRLSWNIWSCVADSCGSDTADYMLSMAVSHKTDLDAFGRMAFAQGCKTDRVWVRVAPSVYAVILAELSAECADTAYIKSLKVWYYTDQKYNKLDDEEALRRVIEWCAVLAEMYTFGEFPVSQPGPKFWESLPDEFRHIDDSVASLF